MKGHIKGARCVIRRSGNTLRLSNVHGQLRSVQLRLVQQLSPAAALDVYKAFAVLRFKPVDEVHEALFTNVVCHTGSLGLPDIANFLQVHAHVILCLDQTANECPGTSHGAVCVGQ